MGKVRVGLVGYGTIGKRVADAVLLQKDMELVGITANSYNYRIVVANERGIPIYALADPKPFREQGISIKGTIKDLLKQADIIVDCSPKPFGKENKEKYYVPNKVKAIFQGGEKKDVGECSFVAQCNYNEAINKDYVRVVSCNTTALCRTLHALNKVYGIERARATLIRRATDPADVEEGPINAIVPTFELPSHHGLDARTVLHDVEIFTTAVVVPTTLMHIHTLSVKLNKAVEPKDVVDLFKKTTRVRVLSAKEKIDSTAAILELGRDLGHKRGDMMEICVWEEGVGAYKDEIFFMQAVHQESNVVPESIDAIRAAMGFKDGKKSIEMTNKSLGIK